MGIPLDVEFQWDVPEHFNFAVDVVDYWAQDPERLALIAVNETGVEQTFTYRDISKAANRLASLLRANGLTKGDRVMVMLPRIAELPNCRMADSDGGGDASRRCTYTLHHYADRERCGLSSRALGCRWRYYTLG